MLVRLHDETGDERKAAAAPLPRTIGNVQTAAGSGPLRRATGTSAQVTAGDPRNRISGGFGMLWLTALTFSLVKEVQAADPNVTFLDDGDITYKDLEHGAFELITKEVIPRYFLVEDPGQTIALRPQGSSVSVSQSTNSAARMAELQAAQQEALATYEKGLGSTGSSTPPPLEPLPVQPINFIQIDNSPPERDLPAQPGSILASVPETIFGKLPPPPPTPPTLNAIIGPTEIDTTAFDVFTATSGSFLASSPNSGATLTFGINGGTAGTTVIDGATYDVSKAGPYGSLYVESTTGAYTFVPDNDAINALVAPTTTNFAITVSDGTLSANQPFTIAINGTNDAAVISGATNGTAIEAGSVANTALGALSATGTLTSTDVDDAPNTFAAVSTPSESAHGFGAFTMTTAGVWTYTVNDANSAVQALNVGDTLTDSFTVTTIDGTPQVVTITINGTNDAAVISGATTGSVTEDGGTKCDLPTTTGTLTATDVDNAPGFTAVNCPTASDAGYGTFTMTADGVWIYKLDDSNCAVQALNVGDTLTDCFTVTTIDGTAQVVTITINGANDAAVICGATTGSVTEAGACTYGTPIATGALTDTDVDNTPNTFTAVCAPKVSEAGYGSFTMTADGVWTYKLDNANCEVQALNDCDTLTDCFKVTTIDGTAQVVTITINGADDTFHFKDKMSDVRTSDVIDLAKDIPASISPSENAVGAGAAPAIPEAAQTIELSAHWHHSSASHALHDLIV
jgi:VCBS repeat-containing protein